MKAYGKYSVVMQDEDTVGQIIVKENNVGIVVDSMNKDIIGKRIVFSLLKPIEDLGEFKFIHDDWILAVLG
jgi:pyocin large subunit-like protein|tara:strand:- start:4387 stop:4599 length:213 start_codon:yes stop_codon:yes gene_type:complete